MHFRLKIKVQIEGQQRVAQLVLQRLWVRLCVVTDFTCSLRRGLLMGQGPVLQPVGDVLQWLARAQLACQQVPAFFVDHDIDDTLAGRGGVEVRQPVAHGLLRDDAVAQAVKHQGAL